MAVTPAGAAGVLSAVTTTTVSDTVYHADGTTATGMVLVNWTAFTTAAGQAIAGGSTSAVIGASGVFTVTLAPNVGATPAGAFYTVTYHLDDGSVSRETWSVPVSSTTVGLAAVRSTVVPSSVAVQVASKSYVDTAVAAALAGQPISGNLLFLNRDGDTMVGGLTLAGDPTTSAQAANKHYVDLAVAAVSTGLANTLGVAPGANQVVVQPAGTQMLVNRLNSTGYASQYATAQGGNGLANAVASPDCVGGCQITIEQGYTAREGMTPALWPSTATNGTHVEDLRGGGRHDLFLNPVNLAAAGFDAGQVIDVTSTKTAPVVLATTGSGQPSSAVLELSHHGLAGGSNLFPVGIEGARAPYFKSNFNTLSVNGSFNTLGQHVLSPNSINCYGVGDCLIGAQFITASGGFRDEADEGAHPMDLQIQEDTNVFTGTCGSGCSAGSQRVAVAVTGGGGTQGEGRFLLDTSATKTISTGLLVGGAQAAPNGIGPVANFSGTNFPVSVFLQTTAAVYSQATAMAPGTVQVTVASAGLPSGFATTTTALPSTSGVACVVEQAKPFAPPNYEMAPYTAVDATHLTMTLNKPHAAGATIAVGGLCGYGLEQTVDTANGIRQAFPVIGSASATSLYYAGGLTQIVGIAGSTSSYLNVSLPISSAVRLNGVATLTTSATLPADVNGLVMTVAGVADTTLNGSFAVTTTGGNTLSYPSAGANSTSSGGKVSVVTGGYVLYPMAEVMGVLNAATGTVDGTITLAPNTVAWATGDTVEEPHYFQENVAADIEFVGQTTPRPTIPDQAGVQYQINVGPGVHGWTINNATPVSSYLGNGGTHTAPDDAFQSLGVWKRTMEAQAGEVSAFTLHCNSHGCGKWNSGYHLFELDSSAGQDTVGYLPQTSALTFSLRGASFGFTPAGFTAPSVTAATLAGALDAGNVATGVLNAARLPVYVGSGTGHAAGAVPDAGSTAGTSRFLREDGIWATPPAGSGGSGGGGGTSGTAAINGGTIQNATITGGSVDGAAIGQHTAAAATFSQLAVTGCNWFLSGSNEGMGTCAPTSWNAVSGVDGTNLQIASPTSARLIVVSGGGSGSLAEFHFVNMGAPSGSRNWRMSNSVTGQYTLDINADDYSRQTIAMQCSPNGACAFPHGLTASNFNGILSGTTGTIGGAALAAGTCASGTAAVSGASVGVPVAVSASDGSLPSGLTMLSAAVTSAGTVSVQVCAVSAVTPRAVAYNVRVLQ